MNIYVVEKANVYQHKVCGLFLTEFDAIDCARTAAETVAGPEEYSYESFVVWKYKTGSLISDTEHCMVCYFIKSGGRVEMHDGI